MHFGSDDLKFKFKWFIARAPFSSIPYPIHTNCTPVINYKRWWNDQNHKHVYNKCTNIRLSRGSRVYLLYDHQMMKRQRFSAENSSLSNKSSQKHHQLHSIIRTETCNRNCISPEMIKESKSRTCLRLKL